MTDIIRQLEAEQAEKILEKRKLPDFSPGDTVRVQVRVTEGKRTRLQAYEGVCIARSGAGFNENFTVRKLSYGEGVERVFPVFSPLVEAVEIVRRGKVRRAKLYYMRGLTGKKARIVENTNARSRKLNDEERQKMLDEKARRRRGAGSREGSRGSRGSSKGGGSCSSRSTGRRQQRISLCASWRNRRRALVRLFYFRFENFLKVCFPCPQAFALGRGFG